ncbi:MAG TPA: hypothetical protein VF469_23890 [Kofleriaceae bacterium]
MNHKISILENDVISLWFYPGRQMIHHQMKTYCYADRFREALNKGVEAMERYRATRWLSDDRANGALPVEDTDWAEQVWLPKAKAAGWRHWSIVQPERVIGQINLARIAKKYAQLGINTRMFSDPDEAFKWLEAAV